MYRRKCDATGKEIISMYPPDCPFKIYEQSYWWSDKWDALSYGREIDFSRPFFEQFRDLQLSVPRMALVNKHSENSAFTNHAADNKNCYMTATVFGSEDILYSDWVVEHCKDLCDCSYMMEGSELCYETYYAWGAYRCCFCEFVKRCQDMWFCFDCHNCKHCFLCSNLRNKEYCFENKQLSKKEYEEKIASIFPLTYSALQTYRELYKQMNIQRTIHSAIYQVQSIDSSGDLLFHCNDCTHCFDIVNSEDCRNCYSVIDAKDSIDTYHIGWAELMYECHAISNGYNCICCHFTYDNRNALYSDCTQNCKNVFGCCSLNQKQYCILNKQYSEQEYHDLAGKLAAHMQKTGEWGKFFPAEFSPFAYNQSRAMEFFPFNRDEATSKNFRWSEYTAPPPRVSKTILASHLPERIEDIPDDILNWAIVCEATKIPFTIVNHELDFYRNVGLPIPRRHPNKRYEDRFAMRTPWRLWDAQCKNCGKKIRTSFSPNRPEIVHCEECYLKEVY